MAFPIEAEHDTTKTLTDMFGPLSLTMLYDTVLSPVWRINFLANVFTGPIYAELIEQFELSRPGFVILFSLSHQDRLVARDICLVTGLPKNSISRAVVELESKGLIARATDAADKRAKPLTITSAGRALLGDVLPLFTQRQAMMLDCLNKREEAELARLIGKLIDAMPIWAQPQHSGPGVGS